ncbi:HNH endonuclease [Actinomyces howellii]|uniref:HNH endonuclease n=1 Tax=Actinomyces howellii TaxID=52771 RepID=A0A448HFZ5_9ACTO|nr:HNH endonuclease [Actinomyces howellii]
MASLLPGSGAVDAGEVDAGKRLAAGAVAATPGDVLLDDLAPGEQALLDAAALATTSADAGTEAGAQAGSIGEVVDALARLGAPALSELIAACGRLASWAAWLQALMAAGLARAPELCVGSTPWEPGGPVVRDATAGERLFNASCEIACRLGVSRTRAKGLLERGQALADPALAPVQAMHRVGLVDDAKTTLIARRLTGTEPDVARAVQEEVLPRSPHRTHAQLARDLDRALAALDPDGAQERRRRNIAGRHVSRPRPAGQGVSEMRLLLPTPDSFLLDATLDAVGASARAAGDERSLAQLRADALVAMSLGTLRGAQHAACRSPGSTSSCCACGGGAGLTSSCGACGGGAGPVASRATGSGSPPDGLTTAAVPTGVGRSGTPSTAGAGTGACGAEAGGRDVAGDRAGPVERGGPLLPDGVPLDRLLVALSDLLDSTSPWWMPSGCPPVALPPGLKVAVDVTVPLDCLVEVIEDDRSPDRPPDQLPDRPPARSPDQCRAEPSVGPVDRPVSDRPRSQDSPSPSPPQGDRRPRGAASPRWEASIAVGGRSAPVPAVVARALAAGGTWRRVVTDPLSGAVVDVGRTRYRPPAALADAVRARDASCTHPGCETPARRCDLDHVVPWAQGGPTSVDNLVCLCQAHHRLKHTPGWSLARTGDGGLRWRTPSGARYERLADGTVVMLPRRVGPRSVPRPTEVLPATVSCAIDDAVIERLERGLAQADATTGAGGDRHGFLENGAPVLGKGAGGVRHGRSVVGGASPGDVPPLDAGRPRLEDLDPAGAGSGGPVPVGAGSGGPGRDGRRQGSGPCLETRGPRPGEPVGAFEPEPYPVALHQLGLAELLDAVAPF